MNCPKPVAEIVMQNDRILVFPHKMNEKSAGGIVIPNADKVREQRATVVAVGPGAWNSNGGRNKPLVEVGHTIVYGKYVGTEIQLYTNSDDHGLMIKETFVAIREDDVIAVIGEE